MQYKTQNRQTEREKKPTQTNKTPKITEKEQTLLF